MPVHASTLRSRIAAVALVGFAVLPDCTCADMRYNRAYQRHVQEAVQDYAHAGTREEIASDVVSMLTARGYAVDTWTGAAGTTTQWHGQGSSARDRFRASMTPAAGGFTVILDHETQQLAEPTWKRQSRDPDEELAAQILERIHPGRAASLTPTQIAGFEYDISPKLLWEAVEAEALTRGYLFQGAEPPIDVTASSMWKVLEGEEMSRSRYDVELSRVAKHALSVDIHRTVEVGVGTRAWETTDESRDFTAELDLIRRRNAADAAAIESEARAEGQQAYDDSLARRDAWCGVH